VDQACRIILGGGAGLIPWDRVRSVSFFGFLSYYWVGFSECQWNALPQPESGLQGPAQGTKGLYHYSTKDKSKKEEEQKMEKKNGTEKSKINESMMLLLPADQVATVLTSFPQNCCGGFFCASCCPMKCVGVEQEKGPSRAQRSFPGTIYAIL
jgi:hypothetical protein